MHVMIDLETLGTRPDAAVLQIGVTTFRLTAGGGETCSIEGWLVNIGSALALGASVDMDTLTWWQAQSPEIREELFVRGNRLDIDDVFDKILAALDRGEEIEGYWSHGAGFDLAILDWYHRRIYGTAFVPYKLARDTRTLWWMAKAIGWTPAPWPDGLLRHDARNDALVQARDVISAYEALERARAAPTAHSPLPTAGEPVAL